MPRKKGGKVIRNPADVRAGVQAEHTTFSPSTGRESSKNIGGVQREVGYSKSGGRVKQVVSVKTTPAKETAKIQQQRAKQIQQQKVISQKIKQDQQIKQQQQKQIEQQLVGQYRAAPEVKRSFVDKLAQKSRELEFSAQRLGETKPLKRQALSFGAFGTSVISGVTAPIRHPVREAKGLFQFVTSPIKSTRELGTSLMMFPATTGGELLGRGVTYGALGKGVKAAKSKALKPFEVVELEGAVTQKGKVVEVGKVTEGVSRGQFRGKGTKFYDIKGFKFGKQKITDVKADVIYRGTKSDFSVRSFADLKVGGKDFKYTGRGRGITSGTKGIEIFELAGGKVKGKTQTYTRGVRGYDVKLGKQDLIKVEKFDPFYQRKVGGTGEFRIEGISKTTKTKTFKTKKGYQPEIVLGEVPEIAGAELKRRGRITTLSDAGIFKMERAEPIIADIKYTDVTYLNIPQRRVSIPKKSVFTQEVPIPKSVRETFTKGGAGFTETIKPKSARTPQLEKSLKGFVPKRIKLSSGQYLGLGLEVPLTLKVKPKIKPTTSFTRASGLGAKQTAIKAVELMPRVKPTFKPLVIPKSRGRSKSIPKSKPMLEPAIKPILEPSLKPNLKPMLEPTLKPALQPTLKPSMKPALKPMLKPMLKPALKTSLKPSLIFTPQTIPIKTPPVTNFFKDFQPTRRGRGRKSTRDTLAGTYKPSLFGLELGKYIPQAPKLTTGIGIRLPVSKRKTKRRGKKKKNG